jgi:hypothetical protein
MIVLRCMAWALLFVVSGCTNTTTRPSLVTAPSGPAMVGQTILTARLVEFSDPATGLVCSGAYQPGNRRPTTSQAVSCNDGATGTLIVTWAQGGRSGSGTLHLADGTTRAVVLNSAPSNTVAPSPSIPPSPDTVQPNVVESPLPQTPLYSPSPRSCCKICRKGKACGNSCISISYTCHKGPGCACNG